MRSPELGGSRPWNPAPVESGSEVEWDTRQGNNKIGHYLHVILTIFHCLFPLSLNESTRETISCQKFYTKPRFETEVKDNISLLGSQ